MEARGDGDARGGRSGCDGCHCDGGGGGHRDGAEALTPRSTASTSRAVGAPQRSAPTHTHACSWVAPPNWSETRARENGRQWNGRRHSEGEDRTDRWKELTGSGRVAHGRLFDCGMRHRSADVLSMMGKRGRGSGPTDCRGRAGRKLREGLN